jgi:hypothetical protein
MHSSVIECARLHQRMNIIRRQVGSADFHGHATEGASTVSGCAQKGLATPRRVKDKRIAIVHANLERRSHAADAMRQMRLPGRAAA